MNPLSPARRPLPRAAALAAALAASVVLSGCGGSGESEESPAAPEGWKTLEGPTVTLAYPKGFTEQSDAERSEHNDAVATLVDGERTVALVSIQSDFAQAQDAQQAASVARATLMATTNVKGTKDVTVQGADEAKQLDFDYTSTGENNTPEQGSTVNGVVITGVDSEGRIYSVRVDAQQGKLSGADRKKITESIQVQ